MAAERDNNKAGQEGAEIALEPYLGYVVSMAVRFFRKLAPTLRHRLEISDLVQDGYVGLLDARTRFDTRRGVRFLTFAHPRIRGEMLKTREKLVRLPAHLEEVGLLGGDEAEGAHWEERLAGGETGPAKAADQQQLMEHLHEALEELPEEYQRLFQSRFGEGKSLQETADAHGMTLSTVYVHLRKGLACLKDSLEARGYAVEDLPDAAHSAWARSLD